MIPSTIQQPAYHQIKALVEDYFDRLGDNPRGMGWPNEPDAVRRYNVMLDVVRSADRQRFQRPIRLLDLGCGTGHLLEHIKACGRIHEFEYTGIDLSDRFIQIARDKHPDGDFRLMDILEEGSALEMFDYAVINGVFTSKCQMSFDEMWHFVQKILTKLYQHTTGGLAVNMMSKQVDWERDDLFHMPLDTLAFFLCRNLTRHFVIRNDYGLYEFTSYIYHDYA
jgi:SAM-dependent methyltransferase